MYENGIQAIFCLCEKTKPKHLSAGWARYVAWADRAAPELPIALAISFTEVTDDQIDDLALQFDGEFQAIIVVLRKKDVCKLTRDRLGCTSELFPSSVIKAKIITTIAEDGTRTGTLEGPVQRTKYDNDGNIIA